MNSVIKTIMLFGVFGVLLILLGRYLGGMTGMYFMAVFAVGMNFFMYFFSDKIAIKSAGAEPIEGSNHEDLKDELKLLAQKAKTPMPKLYISPNDQPNAFATGRNPKHSAMVLTEGLIRHLDKNEIKGVMAHELGHIKNRDILITTIAAVFASIVTTIANVLQWSAIFGGMGGGDSNNRNLLSDLAIIILAPLAALIIQMAISRQREYGADKTGAKLAGSSSGLANALLKIEQISKSGMLKSAKVNPAFANLYISNPLTGRETMSFMKKLFSSHPPVEERVSKLKEMK